MITKYVGSNGRIITDARKTEILKEKTCPSATLSTTNPTINTLGANPDHIAMRSQPLNVPDMVKYRRQM
jgi:hypothetical protein